MKDVNDLMQAILEMDAAQRRESEKARLERSARLAALDEQKQKIIAECDAREKSESAAAARAAEEGNAAALAAQLGREHFNYTTNDEWLAACQEADLLILDDLGTEYITPLTISVLYELINTRMLTHRPTIYTTNITDQSVFVARYTEKVASRMLGGCKMFKFFGTDQRLK